MNETTNVAQYTPLSDSVTFSFLSYCYKRKVVNVTVQEAAAGRINVSVVGFSMGNAWISPDEQTMSYGPMLYQLVNNNSQ